MIIKAITQTKKKVFDQYTIYFYDGSCLTISNNCNSVQGVSQFGEYFGINDADFEEGALEGRRVRGSETMINWFDLPVVVQAHVQKRTMEST